MVVDLELGLTTDMVDALQWVQVESVVVPSDVTAEKLAEMLCNMPLEYPSSVSEDGEFLWDYKDVAFHNFSVLSQVAEAIEGLTITGQSEGPRYWFVSFTYKGEETGIGPGYNK